MRMHQIEVDDEIYSYLKTKAEPFIDTPNDVLRRELIEKDQIRSNPQTSSERSEDWPIFRAGTPKALKQVLDVVFCVKRRRLDRIVAKKLVAERYHIKDQTVNDKFGRQLCGTASKFDKLLEPSNCEVLKSVIVEHFPQESDQIDNFFKALV